MIIILRYIIIILQVLLNLYKYNYNSKSSSLISIISNGIPQDLPFSIPHVPISSTWSIIIEFEQLLKPKLIILDEQRNLLYFLLYFSIPKGTHKNL